MNLRSIGVRLTLWYAAAFAVALVILGAIMWFAVERSLYHAIDESLRDRVEGIRTFIEDHSTRLLQADVKEEFRAHGDSFQVLDDSGRWIYRGNVLRDSEAVMEGTPGGGTGAGFGNLVLNGASLRFLTERVDIGGNSYTIQAAAPLTELTQGLNGALRLLIPLLPIVLVAASAGGYWLSRRALRPVDEIVRTAQSITAQNLSQRLTVPETGDELERLSRTLNEMIERLESAFTRISRFTADASHELRTPLTLMRTTAEVALRDLERDVTRREALEQIIAEVARTSHLVDNLLLIAKADSGDERLQKTQVDMVQTIEEAAAEVSVLASVKGLALETRLPENAASIVADRYALRRLLLILLDNGVKYTPSGGQIVVSLNVTDDLATVTVSDTGIGIPPEDLPHVFERFYRVDRARSRAQGGTGLGLAIGQWIVEGHGGTLTVQSEVGAGSVFHVSLPVS
jgi:two-component system, OmpR family, heavy metal sensor histidine kinase CusS